MSIFSMQCSQRGPICCSSSDLELKNGNFQHPVIIITSNPWTEIFLSPFNLVIRDSFADFLSIY